MADKDDRDSEIMLTLSDFYKVCKSNFKKMLLVAVIFAFFGGYFALTRSVSFKAEASFRDKGKLSSSIGKGLTDLMGTSNDKGGEIISSLKSKRLLSELVHNLNLQIAVAKIGDTGSKWSIIKKNLAIQSAHNKPQPHSPLPEESSILEARNLVYNEEKPIYLTIRFTTDKEFSVYKDKVLIGTSEIDNHYQADHFAFTIKKNPAKSIVKGDSFAITLLPINYVVEGLKKTIQIFPDLDDKSLILISYTHPNRYLAAQVPNELMSIYQNYQIKENDRLAQFQIDYLEKRQSETVQKLVDLLDTHAEIISNDLLLNGFAGSEREMESLSRLHHELFLRDINFESEIGRYENAIQNDTLHALLALDLSKIGDLKEVFKKISELKQQRDSLSLAIQQSKQQDFTPGVEKRFLVQINDLENIHACCQQLEKIQSQIQNGQSPHSFSTEQVNDPDLLLSSWKNKLMETQIALQNAPLIEKPAIQKEYEEQTESFSNYLNNQIRLYDVYSKIIQERLSHQLNPETEYEGHDLLSIGALLTSFSEKAAELEAAIKQTDHVLSKMHEPSFDVHSLDSFLDDRVSKEIVSRTSHLALQLSDQDNRSAREKERIKNEIELHRGFLRNHLAQTIELLNLKLVLFREKIDSLQVHNLDLLHQKITILENHVNESVNERLASLRQERIAVKKQMSELHKHMSNLPYRWVSEQLVKHQTVLNENAAIEMTRLVESKNISHNLELIQSAPLDYAALPILPNSPRVTLFVIAGAVAGFMLSLAYFLLESVVRGVTATKENLKASRQHVSGTISSEIKNAEQPLDEDLSVLRKLIDYFEKGSNIKTLFLSESKGPHYAPLLANLISKKGNKVLLVEMDFTKPAKQDEIPGLLQHLENKDIQPKILSKNGYDIVPAGGITRYSSELTSSKSFQEFLETNRKSYDWIIAYSVTSPISIESMALYPLFDGCVVSINCEKLNELTPIIQLKNDQKTQVSYLFFNTEK